MKGAISSELLITDKKPTTQIPLKDVRFPYAARTPFQDRMTEAIL